MRKLSNRIFVLSLALGFASPVLSANLVDQLDGVCDLPASTLKPLTIEMEVGAELVPQFLIDVTAPDPNFDRPIFLKDPDGGPTSGIGFHFLLDNLGVVPGNYKKKREVDQRRNIRVTFETGNLRPIWLTLNGGALSGRLPKKTLLPTGILVVDPYDVIYTPDFVGPFQRVEFQEGPIFSRDKDEFFARKKNGEVVSVLTCSIDGSVKYPHCDLSFKRGHFWIKAFFTKTLLTRVEEIERKTNQFLDCYVKVIEK